MSCLPELAQPRATGNLFGVMSNLWHTAYSPFYQRNTSPVSLKRFAIHREEPSRHRQIAISGEIKHTGTLQMRGCPVDIALGGEGTKMHHAGVSNDDRMRRDIAVEVGTRRDQHIVTDRHGPDHRGVRADPDTVADHRGTFPRAAVLLPDRHALVQVAVSPNSSCRIDRNVTCMAEIHPIEADGVSRARIFAACCAVGASRGYFGCAGTRAGSSNAEGRGRTLWRHRYRSAPYPLGRCRSSHPAYSRFCSRPCTTSRTPAGRPPASSRAGSPGRAPAPSSRRR